MLPESCVGANARQCPYDENGLNPLESGPFFVHTEDEALKFYVAFYKAARESKCLWFLDFDQMVANTEKAMTRFCTRFGLDYQPAVEVTTVNKLDATPNNNHNIVPMSRPDPEAIGKGNREALRSNPLYREALDLYAAHFD